MPKNHLLFKIFLPLKFQDFQMQVMVVGMLYQPTIFYYPAVLVAFVTVAVKVLRQRIHNERQNLFDSITNLLQVLAVFVHGPSVRSLSKSMTEAESRCESSLQVETTYNALVIISMLLISYLPSILPF